MPLSAGSRLGPYEIIAALGAGGMGEVYRALDTRLNRTVAIKVLPAALCADSDARQRFEREARTISSLQHPNICTLHDIGKQGDVDYLVLEFVEGETLEKRLAKGPLSITQVLQYAAQIADALDKAQRQGIVHRDLKPGNVMLTKSGAKLLDFGLAKLQDPSSKLPSALTDVTVADEKLTAHGMLVGTFQYMAPEQLEGKEADGRSDIFALGAVIYEMVTGKPAFAGKSRASLIASIISSEPASISTVQPMTPPALDRVVRRCLAKDPDDRWQNAGDLAAEVRWIAEGGSQAGVAAPVMPVAEKKKGTWLPWAVAGLFSLLAIAVGALYWSTPKNEASIQAYLPPPDGTSYFFSGDAAGLPVISRQGDRVAFLAADEHGTRLLWIRSLTDGSVHNLPGTESASFPFWSPDGKWVAYFSEGKIRKVSTGGGAPIDVVDAQNARGASWGTGDVILFTPTTQSPLFSVPAGGGIAKQVTNVDVSRHSSHRWPYFLPDGKHFLYLACSHSKPHADLDEIYVASLDGKENRRLTGTSSNAIAVPGYLLFLQGTTLVAQSFDSSSAKLSGEPIVVAQNVHFEEGNWHGVFDAADDGTLLFQPAVGSQGSELMWYSRDGKVLGKAGEFDRYTDLKLSPDGNKVALAIGDPQSSIWIYDLVRGVRTRLTFSNSADRSAVWSPDGKQIYFYRNTNNGAADIYVVDANNAGTEKSLYSSSSQKRPTSVSPDGRHLLFSVTPVGFGVSEIPTTGDIKEKPFLSQKLNTGDAAFSPDGHWVVYTSQETGRSEIFMTQFPDARGKWQVSTNGGEQPRWRGDGKAIFYWAADHTLTEVEVNTSGGQFQVEAVHPLFKVLMPLFPFGSPTYDVTPDGKRFIVNTASTASEQPITVVTNWTQRIPRK